MSTKYTLMLVQNCIKLQSFSLRMNAQELASISKLKIKVLGYFITCILLYTAPRCYEHSRCIINYISWLTNKSISKCKELNTLMFRDANNRIVILLLQNLNEWVVCLEQIVLDLIESDHQYIGFRLQTSIVKSIEK